MGLDFERGRLGRGIVKPQRACVARSLPGQARAGRKGQGRPSPGPTWRPADTLRCAPRAADAHR